MKFGDLKQSKYLKQSDVPQPITTTIQNIVMEDVDDGEFKPIMYGAGLPKGMVINATNRMVLEDLIGGGDDSEVSECFGKTVEVYVDPTIQYAGKRTGGLRLRMPNGQPMPPPQPLNKAADVFAEQINPRVTENGTPLDLDDHPVNQLDMDDFERALRSLGKRATNEKGSQERDQARLDLVYISEWINVNPRDINPESVSLLAYIRSQATWPRLSPDQRPGSSTQEAPPF